MASKYLRRCVRRNSGSFFFSSSSSSSSVATSPHWWRPTAAADHITSCSELVQKRRRLQLQAGLPHHRRSIQSPPRSAVRDGPCSLMLHARGGRSCLSAFSNSSPVSSSATDEGDVDEGDYISISGEENLSPSRQLARRSHSRSKLQGKLLPSFIKSFLHHRSSHNHLDSCSGAHEYSTSSCADEQAAAVHISTEVGSSSSQSKYYTRSWSTPNLIHIRRDISMESKLPQKSCSFGARNLRSRGSSSRSTTNVRGKRVPKGHVAVYVEGGNERRAVPIDYLSHPQFEALLERAHNEFGFGQKGGLLLPCSLPELQHTLRSIHTDIIPSCIKLL